MADWTAAYPPQTAPMTPELLRHTLAVQDDWLTDWVENTPQTNETGRSAVLIAAAAWLTRRYGLPMRLSELGASAGLNLNFDLYQLDLGAAGRWGPDGSPLILRPEWRGAPPPALRARVVDRRGVDINPLDPVADGARLMAYVWPDQPARLQRLDAALTLAQGQPPQVDRDDAGAWLAARLADGPRHGHGHLVYHTDAHQYFPTATQAQVADVLARAGALATPDAPLAHLGMEADTTPGSASLTLRLWPGDVTIPLGRAGFHGEWVDWRAP